jgi:hypothetical protein
VSECERLLMGPGYQLVGLASAVPCLGRCKCMCVRAICFRPLGHELKLLGMFVGEVSHLRGPAVLSCGPGFHKASV